jgi:protoporphyrinogen oxidase
MKNIKQAIIIGAGPAGLTAAYELLKKTDVIPIIYESTDQVGGLSRTVNYKGNRIDIGGHRFFSKSDKVTQWWKEILPMQDHILDPEKIDDVMLVRSRLSRIFFLRKFFNYPISLSLQTIKNLGFKRMCKIGFSYIKIRLFPIKDEKTLKDFFINRFGKELYLTFFKDYTQKVWGVPCDQISAAWGAQRIKGLSIGKAILHAIKSTFVKDKSIGQKSIETTLIGQFAYPKYGPGHMWEVVAKKILAKGGRIFLNHEVVGIDVNGEKIIKVKIKNKNTDEIVEKNADFVFSSMPVKDLINRFKSDVPAYVKEISDGLVYRDFITAGLLLKNLKYKLDDNWIYIQERDVKVGRMQIFNNWSPYMVKDKKHVWMGLEYFANEGDELWSMPEDQFKKLAINELYKLGFIEKSDVIDSIVIKMPKAYPAYFGSYDKFDLIKNFLDQYQNLFLIGRNGMHRYNNMDHSMLAAMQAVQNVVNGEKNKENIWSVNAEKEYHEQKTRA